MKIRVSDNPTRQMIMMLLKRNERMSIAELSREMNITHMAVRQHMIYLERRGDIGYTVKKCGVGRPVFQYFLTEKATEIFPNAYGRFTSEVLKTIVDLDGRKKLDRILKARKENMLEEKMKLLSEFKGLSERVERLADHLDEKGYMVELHEGLEGYRLKKFNCLLPDVVAEFPEACKYELELYQDLLGKDVTRVQCKQEGDASCEYSIPKS